jgi:hypothetical protein
MNDLSTATLIPETSQLKQFLTNALSSISTCCQLQVQQGTTLFLFEEHLEYSVEWKYRRYYLSQQRGANWRFLFDEEDIVEFAAAAALHIANERIEATLYQR